MGKVIAICTSKHKGTLKNEVSEANFIEEMHMLENGIDKLVF